MASTLRAYVDFKDASRAANRMDGLLDRLESALRELGEIIAQRAATWAKQHRKWIDRTNQARGGLTGRARQEAGRLVIILFHTAAHGKWLELAKAGRYAIIMQALQSVYPQLVRMATRLIQGG